MIRNLLTIGLGILTASALVGCSSTDTMSPEENKKVISDFKSKPNYDNLTPAAREGMKKYMGGAAPASASGAK